LDEPIASRIARAGDKLLTISLRPGGSCGFVTVGESGAVVRLLPGTELEFDKAIRFHHRFSGLRFGGCKVAKFRRLSTTVSNGSHNVLELSDGRIVTLTQLATGQAATVRQIPPAVPAA
jgi:hypothetical protein